MNWYTSEHKPRWPNTALPVFGQRLARPNDTQMDEAVKAAFAEARNTRRGVLAAHLRRPGQRHITLQTPVFRDREFLGSIAAVFSVEGILKRDIPPELSAKYKISIIDVNNRELTTTSTRPRLPRDMFYDLPLDPPGQGISVRVYAYPQLTNFTNNTLVWLVAGLSCFVLWSLWSLWKHTRQRFEAQQALYAEAFFRRAMENSVLIGMRVLDMHGRITHVNPAFCRMTGWDESDLVGKNAPFAYWPRDAYPEMQRQLDMTLRGKAPSSGFELRVRRKDGSFFHARLYVSPLIDSSGRQTGWMSSMTDIQPVTGANRSATTSAPMAVRHRGQLASSSWRASRGRRRPTRTAALPAPSMCRRADRRLGAPDRLDVVDDRHHQAETRTRGARRRPRTLHHRARKPRRRGVRAGRRRSRAAVRQPLLPAPVRHPPRRPPGIGGRRVRYRRHRPIRSTWWIPMRACPPPR